ncbi:MAG TPA: S8 family serine peptidase [Longimicrobium sp.]|jgi:subtilisin family serine protease
MRFRPLAATAFLAALAACSDQADSPVGSSPRPTPAPVRLAAQGGINGSYVVVLKEGADARAVAAIAKVGARHVYSAAITGFAAELNAGQLNALQHNPNVEYIEQDARVQATTTQTGATWGLDRIDQRALPLNGTYTYTPTGAGVNVYIIDTGINFAHTQFGGRAVSGYDAVDGGTADDCNGHGTHVAGTVGGSTYGVAKGATLVGVRVLDCAGSGTNAGVIAGMDWVAQNRVLPAAANMSLGGGASQAVDDAIQRMVNAGVTVAVAAGNENQNACNTSPARAAAAITVGATTNTDARASFSNYGSCLDVFAPGNNITSAWYTSTTATNTISGTSMASPHVAGVAALYLQGNPTALPAAVTNAIVSTATTGKVTSANTGSPNKLLFSLLTLDTGGGTGVTTSYAGSLSGTNTSQYQPSSSGYVSAGAGVHTGILSGPAGTDFDLYLERWNGSSWTQVTTSLGSTSSETINYNATAGGTYRWRIYSYMGAGNYTFTVTRPN